MPDERPVRMLPELIATKFKDFCRYEYMVEYGAPAWEHGQHMCKLDDTFSGFRMFHNFTVPCSNRQNHERDRAVLMRRVDRLYQLAGRAKHVLFVLATDFKFNTCLVERIYQALVKAFPGVEIELVNMQFSAGKCEEFDLLDGRVHVVKLERKWNFIYDTHLTAPDWNWMDRLSVIGMLDYTQLRKRNLLIKWLYKLWIKAGRYLEKRNAGCANMSFGKWDWQ